MYIHILLQNKIAVMRMLYTHFFTLIFFSFFFFFCVPLSRLSLAKNTADALHSFFFTLIFFFFSLPCPDYRRRRSDAGGDIVFVLQACVCMIKTPNPRSAHKRCLTFCCIRDGKIHAVHVQVQYAFTQLYVSRNTGRLASLSSRSSQASPPFVTTVMIIQQWAL